MIAPRTALAAALAFSLPLPFLGRPPHVDDANFLVLARGAALDPWRPHAIAINWQGQTQPAFEVLSNPPGLAWWLAPLHDAAPWALHLAMLPWLALALFGAARLGRALASDAAGGLILLGASPLVGLAAASLTPDLPLLACTLAGLGGFLGARRHAGAWALLAGSAVLFRYSGICVLPLVLLAGWQRGRLASALPALLPLAALILHDLHAYGQAHILAMTAFQSVSNTPREVLRKGVAALAMLGGVGLLPLVSLRGRGWGGALVGAALGALGASLSGHDSTQTFTTIAFAAAGGAALAHGRPDTPAERLLLAWTWGGLLFLLTLRFAAARYWLPFLAGPALLALRARPGPWRLGLAAAVNAALSLALNLDDAAMARAWDRAARDVAASGPAGTFAGHWGWQWAMERAGWRALEEGEAPGGLHAVALAPWPQEHDPAACLSLRAAWRLEDHNPGPRVHSAAAAANLHAFLVAGDPPTETYAPWSFADEPYDRVLLLAPCDGP